MITGVVLAAGSSERMGEPKLLLPYRGGTVLSSTVQAVARSSVDRLVVVTGPDESGLDDAFDSADVGLVRNTDPTRGNMSSLLSATDADSEAEAFIVLAGDLPTMRSTAIDALIDIWDDAAPWAAVTAYTDRIAHPFLLSQEAVAEIRHHEGSKVLWRVLIESADPRVVGVVCDHIAPIDVNTPADYRQLCGG